MQNREQEAFVQIWPKYFVIFTAILECITVILLFLTELGNVAANFWRTNVFAGGWTGIILLIHTILLFLAGCCSPNRPAAFRAVVLSFLGLIATAAAISFNIAFLIVPNACLLTSSCDSNAGSTSNFAYGFQQSFFSTFRGMNLFANYTESQIKYLFQSIQIGVAAVGFLICLIYLIVFYIHDKKTNQLVRSTANTVSPAPAPLFAGSTVAPSVPRPPPMVYPPLIPPPYPENYQPSGPPLPPPSMYYQAPPPVAMWYPPPPRAPQPPPGHIPWNTGPRY